MSTDTAIHPFDLATTLKQSAGGLEGNTSPHYANFVGPFGGIIAATLLKAVMEHPQRQGDPLALTVNFAAPIADGQFQVSTRVLRTNRSTQHWSVELSQQGEIAASAMLVCAAHRESWSSTEIPMPQAPVAALIAPIAVLPGMPAWINGYQLRFIRGNIHPLPQHEPRAEDNSESLLWVRDEPARPLDFPALAALCDVFFPRIFVRQQRMMPIATVSMTAFFHTDAQTLEAHGARELLGHARAQQYGGGYHDQTAELWTPEGKLLATTSQIVYFKE